MSDLSPIQWHQTTGALDQLGIHTEHHLTPEAMMIYLSARLSSIDAEIQELFDKQQLLEKLKEPLHAIQNVLAGADGKAVPISNEQAQLLVEQLELVRDLDQGTFDDILDQLQAAGIDVSVNDRGGISVAFEDGVLTARQAEAFRGIIDGASKTLDSSAQLEMIKLQSLMSQRQTLIQMSSNIVASLGKSDEAIAANFR